ncbi:MAG: class I SAM-dependent methyltransferase [Pseudomonadota bacterium]
MRSDTADQHWAVEWAKLDADSKWRKADPDVMRWADGLDRGARVLDLGAGVGRHALALADAGFVVTALDASSEGLAEISAARPDVPTVEARMTALPFDDESFDHVLSWNVIYHGDQDVLRRTIAEIRRVLKPGGTFLGTMLSKRRLAHQRAGGDGREISINTWVFDADGPGSDKHHPHYYCNAAELLALFEGFEVMWLEDRPHDSPGSWHWHLMMERTG